MSALLAGCVTTTPARVRWEGTSNTASRDIIVVVENLVWNDASYIQKPMEAAEGSEAW